MSGATTNGETANKPERKVLCKVYHDPLKAGQAGAVRKTDRKSTCPAWACNLELQQALIDEALSVDGCQTDSYGRPKRIWNGLDGMIFVGVSCNMEEPLYNCYPEVPPEGKLFKELQKRVKRSRDDFLPKHRGQ